MAKRIKAAQLIFEVGDDGTLKMVGQKADKAAKSMKKLGGASQETDRRIKGVTQQSSNATKNFSKQAQTMQGGIVAVYATIAAQVFAVSAAFQFLKEAMDTRNMIQGQAAFAAATGVAYASITANIQKATGGMLQFKEAGQAAAIGIAAGLSAGQLERLGTAAKNTSLALGRDLTDSFNRLVRGATKAEPELLDELGIVLRLEPAMKKYAATIGKSAKDLNQFEKTQAVTNEVLDQAESKFGIIEMTMDESAFALNQFLKAWDDFMKGIKETVGNVAAKVLPFFSKNIGALIASLTLFLLPILRTILPNFKEMAKTAENSYGIAEKAANDAAIAFERAKTASKLAGGGAGAITEAAAQSRGFADEHGIELKGEKGTLSKRQLGARRRELKKKTSKWRRDPAQLKAYESWLDEQEGILMASEGKKQNILRQSGAWINKHWKGLGKKYKTFQLKMVSVTKWAAKAMNFAMAAMGWLAVGMMIWEVGKALKNLIWETDKLTEKQKEMAEATREKYDTLGTELEGMLEIQQMGILDLSGAVQQLGNAASSIDLKGFAEEWNKSLTIKDNKERANTLKSLTTTFEHYVALLPKSQQHLAEQWRTQLELSAASKEFKEITYDANGALEGYSHKLQTAGSASKLAAENAATLTKALRGVVGAAKDLKFQGIIQQLRQQIKSFEVRDPIAADIMANDPAIQQVEADREKWKKNNSGKWRDYTNQQAAIAALKDTDQGQRAYTTDQLRAKNKTYNQMRHADRTGAKGQALKAEIDRMKEHNKLVKQANVNTNNTILAMQEFDDQAKQAEATAQKRIDTIVEDNEQNKNQKKVLKDLIAIRDKLHEMDRENIESTRKIAALSPFQDQARMNRSLDEQHKIVKNTTKSKWEEYKAALKAYNIAKATAGIGETEAQLEERENALATLQLAADAYRLAFTQEQVDKKIKDHAKDKLKWEREAAKLAHTHSINAQERAREEKSRADWEKEAVGQVEKRQIILKKEGILDKEKLDIAAQITAKEGEMKDLEDDKLIFSEDYLKMQRELDILKENEKNKELEILQIIREQSVARAVLLNQANLASKTEDFDRTYGRYAGEGTDPFGSMRGIGDRLTGRQKAYADALKKHKVSNFAELEKKASGDFAAERFQWGKGEDRLEGDAARQAWMADQGITDEKEAQAHYAKQVLEDTKKTAVATADLERKSKLYSEVQSRIGQAFDQMFDALFDNTKSFGDAMKDLLKSLTADLAKMYLKQAALSMMSGMGFATPTGGRYGGVFSGSGKSFFGGGIAAGPSSGYLATLHGTEAVIPLGNDRTIPVHMTGGGGNNTVNVAVNMNGNNASTSTQGGDGNMQALGRSIGGLVQQHLQQEMRPGGLLNKQGTKGRYK